MSDELWFEPPCTVEKSRVNWLFPGLGCRYVGMGHDLFERPGIGKKFIRVAEEVLGYPLAPLCLEGSGRKVVPPRQEAEAIYVLNCAYAAALGEQGHSPRATLGHSLGSWSAAWAAGIYDFVTGLQLVTHVEQLLEELVDGRDLSMGAIIGLDESTVSAELEPYKQVTIANFNSPAQYVIGGPVNEVDCVLQAALARGAKQAKRLPTSRAIHTPWMGEVTRRLQPRLNRMTWSNPVVPFMACDSAKELGTGPEVLQFFSNFLVRPVQWQQSFCTLCQINTSRFVEVGPGTLLKSLASFIDSSAVVGTATDWLEAT